MLLALASALGPAVAGEATRGIAVALEDHFTPMLPWAFAEQLAVLRGLGCHLPVEVWESGQELAPDRRQMVSKLGGVRMRDLSVFLPDVEFWRGWQIKGAIPRFTAFDELILIDGDIGFARNPEILFLTPEYQATGTYFFRDEQSKWRFFADEGSSLRCKSCNDHRFYRSRKRWLQGLLGSTMPPSVPKEWAYHWVEKTVENSTKEVMDSGVVLLDRRRHPGLIRYLFELNANRSTTYKYVYGDKETFWLAAVMANEPFALHPIEGAHECCSILCYATMAHSYQWRHRVQLNNGDAERGTHLRGLIQRFPDGRAIYYHRKTTDMPPLSSFTLEHNAALCRRGWGIAELNDTTSGIKLTSRLARAVDARFRFYWLAFYAALVWCCCQHCSHTMRYLRDAAETALLRRFVDPNDMEPLLSERRRAARLRAEAEDSSGPGSPESQLVSSDWRPGDRSRFAI